MKPHYIMLRIDTGDIVKFSSNERGDVCSFVGNYILEDVPYILFEKKQDNTYQIISQR